MVTYQTGVASTPTDLLNKLITFIEANGWDSGIPLSGDVVIWNGTSGAIVFAGIDATTTGWSTRGCLSFSAGAAWDAQPNAAPVSHTVVLGAGPYIAYHFYVGNEAANDYVHVTVEITAGNFRQWVLGQLVKSGSYAGGVYADSATPSTNALNMNAPDTSAARYVCDSNNSGNETGHLWIDYDAKVNNWQRLRGVGNLDPNECGGTYRNTGIYHGLIAIGPQDWNLRTPLFPMIYWANRGSSLRSIIGRVPNMRFINVRNFTPGELVTYGAETWQVFPVFAKFETGPGNGVVSSGLYGYAHLR